MEIIYYRFSYKTSGTVWKHFKFEAKSDVEVLEKVKQEMTKFNIKYYKIEKIIEKIIFET